jgi:acetolactate synthase I/II/III large subunit
VNITGAEALIRSLEQEDVEVVFGLPGGAILPVYDPLLESSIRHILVRHEQGAGHMAEGYALATGRPGVAMVTSGPGATNIVTPIANAHMDSTPLVVITGQVPTANIGTDAFQECDITGITMGITKHNFLVQTADELPRVLASAFHLATTGRPGPVLVDVPKDVAQASMEWWWPSSIAELDLPGYRPVGQADEAALQEAAALLASAERPVLYVGGGVLKGHASVALLALAEQTGAPVVTTLMARGAFPDSHPQHLGMPGMHGTYAAITALQRADLLVTLGARFDDRVTGKVDGFAPVAKVIHFDIDRAEINKIRRADVAVHGDLALSLQGLVDTLGPRPQLDRWWGEIRQWQKDFPLYYEPAPADGLPRPQAIVEEISRVAGPQSIVSAGVGQHQMYAAQFWQFEEPGSWINSGGAGTMGFGIPAAIGAKVGRPDRSVWCIDGDGCFQMTAQELVTARLENIPIKVAILNNSYLGMVRQWQEMFYDERYSEVFLSPDLPDYVKWAEAMGCVGLRATTPAEATRAIEEAESITDVPVVIDFRTDWREKVFPMVPSGASNDDVLVHPHQQRGAK